jgi:hypothetical protein
LRAISDIEATIAGKIVESDPALDIQGSDRKMLKIAHQDFINYAKFVFGPSGAKTNNREVAKKIARFLENDHAEVEAFVGIWAGLWLKKWRQRVKLVLDVQNKASPAETSKSKPTKQASLEELENEPEAIAMIVSALIRNAEICGTEIMAENLLKVELMMTKGLSLSKEERFFAVVTGALKYAHELVSCSSPMIFVKVDKSYFSAAAQQT